jgi:hypothetical protein
MHEDSLHRIVQDLSETSRHLAETASTLVDNAVRVGVAVKMPKGATQPVGPPAVDAATTAGVTVSVPPAGLPFAESLSHSAVPVALAAPIAAKAAPIFAPMISTE